jgi:ribosome biogenesis protein Tsr3
VLEKSVASEKMDSVPLHIIHLDQDDPKKCTARKMSKYDSAILHHSVNKSPKRGFLLNPRSTDILGPDDSRLINLGASIVALDCSWKQIQSVCPVAHSIQGPTIWGQNLSQKQPKMSPTAITNH